MTDMSEDDIMARAAEITAQRKAADDAAVATATETLKGLVTGGDFQKLRADALAIAKVTPLDNQLTYMASMMGELAKRFGVA